MITWKIILDLIARCLLYSLLLIVVDSVLIIALNNGMEQVTSLSFVILLEGGIGLAVGGVTVLYSPMGAKITESLFRTKPWNRKRQKEVEKQAEVWITTGVILVLAAFLVSSL